MRGRASVVADFVGLVACLVVIGSTVTACTASDDPADASGPETSALSPSGGGDPTAGADPTTASTPTSPSTSPPATQPTGRQPLVIAVSPLRPTPRISEAVARRLIDGEVRIWAEIGEPGGALDLRTRQTLPRSPLTIADAVVVPAEAVTPLVQVAVVGGVDPLLTPSAYPLRTSANGYRRPQVNRVTVVGDIMLGRAVGARTPDRPGATLSPMTPRLAAADVTVGNLESTLSDDGPPLQGGDSFAADPRVLLALERAGFDVLSLANNHTGDFGPQAFRQTLARIDGSSIGRVGAGRNAAAAWRPRVVEQNGVSFGFVAFNAIGETPRAGASRPGAAEIRMPIRTGPLNDADLQHAESVVRRLAQRVDVVVVLPHWGDQYTNQPLPVQRVVGSALLDAGADVVVGGHPHWVQGVEVHDGRLIVNSLGNFIFDMDTAPSRQGVTVDLVTWDAEIKAIRFTPYVIGPDFAPRPVRGPVARTILERMWETSDPPFNFR